MSFDDLKKMGQHIESKRTRWRQPSRWKEQSTKPRVTFSYENFKSNTSKLKGLGKKGIGAIQKGGDKMARTFPGIADGSFDEWAFGYDFYGRRKKK